MLKIGLVGAGHLGKIHLRCLQLVPQWSVVGFYDTDDANARAVESAFGIRRFEDADRLIAAVDALDIVTPTPAHFEWAVRGIQAGKHLFIEKPLTETGEQAARLQALAAAQPGLKIQVGHVERFNPAVQALNGQLLAPKFIEAHRLGMFNPRGTDVSVVMDLMIHDLDMVLQWVDSPVRAVYANGVAVVSHSPDIANARIEFENGAVANLTASRISLKQMRKFRIFQSDAYISMDLLNKKTEVVRLHEAAGAAHWLELETARGKRYIEVTMPEVPVLNAIERELEHFAVSILEDSTPTVSLAEAAAVVQLADRITRVIGGGGVA